MESNKVMMINNYSQGVDFLKKVYVGAVRLLRTLFLGLTRLGRIKSRANGQLWYIAVPFVFLVIMIFFFPFRGKFQFNSDEGVNLIKAMLVDQGYSLYDEIWSDQPPLFTHLLTSVFRIFGYKVGAGRFLVLIFSSTMLWASFQFMRVVWGEGSALAGVFLIFLLPQYLVLSISVMIGIPAITFAVLSLLALTFWHRQRKYLWLILSAAALGLSILTKLFAGFLAPLFVLGIVIAEYSRMGESVSWGKLILPVVLWGAVFTVLTLGLSLVLVGPENVGQLVEPHLTASEVDVFRDEKYFTLAYHLRGVRPILFLALVGAIMSLKERQWLALYPIAWILTAYLLLFRHAPVWDHQQLLITIPVAMLAASAVFIAGRWILQSICSHFDMSAGGELRAVAIVGLISLFFIVRTPEAATLLSPLPSISTSGLELDPDIEKFLIKMRQHAPKTQWVVTDLPMYAFRARLLIPPNLAVITMKRLETGNLTEAQVIDTVREWMPEQVLLGRFKFPSLNEFLEEHYRLIQKKGEIKLFLRNDL